MFREVERFQAVLIMFGGSVTVDGAKPGAEMDRSGGGQGRRGGGVRTYVGKDIHDTEKRLPIGGQVAPRKRMRPREGDEAADTLILVVASDSTGMFTPRSCDAIFTAEMCRPRIILVTGSGFRKSGRLSHRLFLVLNLLRG